MWVECESKGKAMHPGSTVHKENNAIINMYNFIDEVRKYIPGDTDLTEETKQVKCDILFVPIGGTYTMNYREASSLCNIIMPNKVTPIHYGSIVGKIEDGYEFSKLIDKNIEVNLILK